MENKITAYKHDLVLHLSGPSIQGISATLPDTGTTHSDGVNSLDTYFSLQRNCNLKGMPGHQAHEASNGQVDQFITDMTMSSRSNCDFDKYSLDPLRINNY